MAILQLPSCRQGGTCTYEGLECPNALEFHIKDSLAYSDCEATVDILMDSINNLNTQISAYQLKDHSHIPTSFTVVTLDTTQPNWKEYSKYFTPTVIHN